MYKKNCNNTEAVQNKSNLQIKIILQNTQTFRVFTIAIKQKLFTEYIKKAKQRGLNLGGIGIFQLKGWSAKTSRSERRID
jgi:hypothetical protein